MQLIIIIIIIIINKIWCYINMIVYWKIINQTAYADHIFFFVIDIVWIICW